MATVTNNYSLGKGEISLSPFKTGTQDPVGFKPMGNCPDFSIKVTSKTLDHYSSTAGIREKDDQAVLDTERTSSITTDNLSLENLAKFFLGEVLKTSVLATVTVPTETIDSPEVGVIYPLGLATYPAGARGINASTVDMTQGATTLVLGTDFLVDEDAGTVEFISGGAFVTGTDVVSGAFNLKAATHEQVISGTTPFEGALRFKATQAKGKKIDFHLPWVKVTPDGDYSLIGETWGEMKFAVEILKPVGKEAIYANGVPAYA